VNGFPLLSLVLWLPLIGSLLLLVVPRDNQVMQRGLALGVSLLTLVASLPLYFGFDFTQTGFQFAESLAWIDAWGIGYRISLDGVSLWLVLLTTFLTPLALVATWNTVRESFRMFQALVLLLETSLLGVFVAQDLFLFYIFWEFTLIPMALMIGIWGGPNRVRAALKFFLYTFIASVFMLASIVGISIFNASAAGAPSFDIAAIQQNIQSGVLVLDSTWARVLFLGFFLAFAVKTPIWPFHTWLPETYTQAPTPAVFLLAAVMSKMGAYGLIRFCVQLFPEVAAVAAPAIAVLAVIGILYGAMVAFAQSDIKKLVAYSSVSHLGFVVLGIFALTNQGLSGALIQMVNHGLSTGALFLIVGIIEQRRGTRVMAELGGLWKVMPIFGGLTLAMVMSSVGLPGLNGFIGEFAILQGTWVSTVLGRAFAIPAAIGVILAATYLLRMFSQTFMGELDKSENAALTDIKPLEIGMLVVLLVPIVLIGFYPNFVFEAMQPTVQAITEGISSAVTVGR
jgi:NADH-quinone oxidoreductase subunit M